MPKKALVQTRPASERYHDLLGRMDDDLRDEVDLVVSVLLLEHERNVQAKMLERVGEVETQVAEHRDVVAGLGEVVTRLAAHYEVCPVATPGDRKEAEDLAARWARRTS